MAVLSVGLLFFALSAAEEQTSENIQEEVPVAVLMPIETFAQANDEELSDDCLGTEADKESESPQQVETDTINHDGLDPSDLISEEMLTLPECTLVIIISTELDESSVIEDVDEFIDESELLLDIKEDISAYEGSEPEEIDIEVHDTAAGFDYNFADEEIVTSHISDEESLISSLPQEVEPFQIPHRIISSDDFSSSTYITQLVLEKTSNGYKAVQDMTLLLTISNCSDKAIRVKAAVRFEAGTAQLYEALGFTVPKEPKDIILGAGEEQSMTWAFYCRQDVSSGTVSAIPAETDLTFRLDFICEWDDVI